MPPKGNFQAAIPLNQLAGMVYSSPLDFTAIFNASSSLTITFPSGAGFVPADANDILWLGIRYINAAGQDVYLDNSNYDFDYESGTGLLTVTPDPGFAAGGQWAVSLLGPPRLESSLSVLTSSMDSLLGSGLPGSYSSPFDFTATRYDADELSLTGLPTTPTKAQFISVVEKVNGTIRQKWVAGVDRFEWDSTNERLQVVGVTFSADASAEWIVTYIDQVKSYDSILNALQTLRMDAHQWDWIDRQLIADAEDLSTAYTSAWLNVKGQTSIGLYVTWTTPATAGAYTVDIEAFANDTDAGTNQYHVNTGDWEYQGTPAATISQNRSALQLSGVESQTYRDFVRINVRDVKRLQLKFTEGIPGALHITLSCAVILQNP